MAGRAPTVGARYSRYRARIKHAWAGRLPMGVAAVVTHNDGSVQTVPQGKVLVLDPAAHRAVSFVAGRIVTYDAAGRHVGLVVRLDIDG